MCCGTLPDWLRWRNVPHLCYLLWPHVVVEAKTIRQTSRRVILRPHKSDPLLLIAKPEFKSFPLVFSDVASLMCIFFHCAILTNVHKSKLVQIQNIYLLFRVMVTPRVNTNIATPPSSPNKRPPTSPPVPKTKKSKNENNTTTKFVAPRCCLHSNCPGILIRS